MKHVTLVVLVVLFVFVGQTFSQKQSELQPLPEFQLNKVPLADFFKLLMTDPDPRLKLSLAVDYDVYDLRGRTVTLSGQMDPLEALDAVVKTNHLVRIPLSGAFRIARPETIQREEQEAERKEQDALRKKQLAQREQEILQNREAVAMGLRPPTAENRAQTAQVNPAVEVEPEPVLEQDTDRLDPLGLETQSVASQKLIPVGVASAVEASRLPQALNGIFSYYFGGGSYYGSSELGNELQPTVGDLLMKQGYAPIVPKTGFQGQHRALVRAEITPDHTGGNYGRRNQQELEPLSATAQFVIVPTISFITVTNKGSQENLRPLANIVGGVVRNRTANQVIQTVGSSDRQHGDQKVKATFALRFYNRDGIQIKAYEACPQEIKVADYRALNAALIYQTSSASSSTFKPLADLLMAAMEERMKNPNKVCKK